MTAPDAIVFRTAVPQLDGPTELDQLGALFRAVGFQRNTAPDYLRQLVDGSRWVVSAWHEARLVGFARAIADGVANAYITTVAVDPAYQRRGIGRGLIERLVADRPTVKFVLHTSDAGERLYRSLGFVDAPRMLVRDRTA
ncbi:MAG: GNAT family N-acetyltransferase [Myxococcota bacterium]